METMPDQDPDPPTHTTTTSTGHVLTTTTAGLTYRLTPSLRYLDGALQQRWVCVGTGPDLWLPIPTSPPPEAA